LTVEQGGKKMALNVEHLLRTAETLEQALFALAQRPQQDDIMFDLFRNAAIKSFELSLETSGKLLRKALKAFTGAPREVDKLVFNDVLRHAGKHGLMDAEAVARWLIYRSNRNNTAHDYGVSFANETLKLLPAYVQDVRALAKEMQRVFDAEN
jgi:nucleotidyltransferase substrate binding protein (TIGR01987 family)